MQIFAQKKKNKKKSMQIKIEIKGVTGVKGMLPSVVGNGGGTKRDHIVSCICACEGAVFIVVGVAISEWASTVEVLYVRCRLTSLL